MNPRFRQRGANTLAHRGTPMLCVIALLLAACKEAPPPRPPAVAPAIQEPMAPPVPAAPTPAPTAMPSADFPPGPLYFCDAAGTRAPIVYEPRVEQLCRRHPEMGPCQYERDACRAKGGRVLTARDEEVTPAVEGEYDRVVARVRFPGDSGPPPDKR